MKLNVKVTDIKPPFFKRLQDGALKTLEVVFTEAVVLTAFGTIKLQKYFNLFSGRNAKDLHAAELYLSGDDSLGKNLTLKEIAQLADIPALDELYKQKPDQPVKIFEHILPEIPRSIGNRTEKITVLFTYEAPAPFYKICTRLLTGGGRPVFWLKLITPPSHGRISLACEEQKDGKFKLLGPAYPGPSDDIIDFVDTLLVPEPVKFLELLAQRESWENHEMGLERGLFPQVSCPTAPLHPGRSAVVPDVR